MKGNKTLKYLLVIVVVLILFVVIGKKAGWIGSDHGLSVITEKVDRRTIVETVSASGKVQPEVEVKISADVSGEIVELYVKEGDQVKKGDILCKINPDLYLSSLDRMEASVNTSKANLANSKARLSQIKAQFANADASFKRNKVLYDEKAISQSEFDAAKASYESSKADVEASEQSVAAAEFNVSNALASLKEAKDNLNRTTIFSPVNGKISRLNIEKGERVVGTSQMAGTEIMRIADLNEMEVNVDVNENDIIRLRMGDTADIEIDAYLGRTFSGVVTEIANSANNIVGAADQVTNFAVKVRIFRDSYADLIDSLNPNLFPFRPGMSAAVDIRTKTVYRALSVPIQAVSTRIDSTLLNAEKDKQSAKEIKSGSLNEEIQEIVFVKKQDRVYLTKVKTGIQDNNYIEILSGLSGNEEVVSGPYSAVSRMLKDSMLVKVVTREELFKKTDGKD